MAVEKHMDGLVPFPVELFVGVTIPPVFVKLAVVEFAQFCKEVAHLLENYLENED